MITLSKKLKLDPLEYASQGNAILGIRDSGKTYTATYLAEQLIENNIPIIAFDPIGIWKYLKVGKTGKGLPVVVAGDEGDLPLSPENAPGIVRAAMKENVSLVIDLYSMQLSKNDWKRIVEQCIRLLLYENKQCGLRHIFIEEAAEFVPQRIMNQEGKVYAEIEKLARMGGNASLGYTLINQRAEEVNKAVLELCDCLFLHRQKGRHSLTALTKWLDVADANNTQQIIKSLPSLNQGECWVWLQGSHKPELIKIPEKKTMHPDRRNPLSTTHGIKADVTQFVTRLLKAVGKPPASLGIKENTSKPVVMNNNNEIKLKAENEDLQNKLKNETKLKKSAEEKLSIVKKILQPQYDQLKKVFENISVNDQSSNISDYQMWIDKFTGKKRKMLELIIEHKKLDRQKWCFLSGVPYTSKYFDQTVTQFKKLRLVEKQGNDFNLLQMN